MDLANMLSIIQTILTAIQTLLTVLQSFQLKDLLSDLNELCSVVATVQKVLLDAESKYDELSQETLFYIEELRGALYDADDLLDEFVTLAKQKELMEDHKFIKKVRLFFSRDNQFGVAYKMSRGVNKIMKKLDGIASKHNKFGLKLDHNPIKFGLNLDHKPIMRRREETCSYTNTEIIGREDDVEKIVGMLLDSDVKKDVSFLTIVGIGGLGKTALAQLVFNHERITKEFPLRLWVCVSDHDQSKLDVKSILAQIVQTATGKKLDGNPMEVVVNRLREVLAHKRFLIVLDDLWNESRDELGKLVGHLVGGSGGSQVVVTTRSKETAKMVGNGLTYELEGLSVDNSWRLFQLMAFGQVLDQVSSSDYVDFINIGQEIVKICVDVPLAIRVIGSLLYGQDKTKWVSVQELGLASLRDDQNGIMPILKLSYHNLESQLKSCFGYCSLYPKDYTIKKEILLSLWISQGYVVPRTKGQSIIDASEEYFLILLRRCFFQDIKEDEFGEIKSFKLHDLMHDVALEVAEKEICTSSSFTGDVGKAIRHVSLMRKHQANWCFTKAHIRTYLCSDSYPQCNNIQIDKVLANYKCLRAMDLGKLEINSLPCSIGKLIHLRYLDLSYNNMEVLPKSVKKLYNLHTLNLNYCKRLKELPNDLSKLVNLMVLKLEECYSLRFMPSGMGNLTGLYKLSKFVVGEREQHAALEGLKALKNLRGSIDIEIHFPKSSAFFKDDKVREGGYIKDREQLNRIMIKCKSECRAEGPADYEEELLDFLQPHVNLKELELKRYFGMRMPAWAEENKLATSLPNLVRLELDNCSNLRCLSSLGKLYLLKSLTLRKLPNLEYVESQPTVAAVPGRSNSEGLQFLPSLEELTLFNLPKLKEWCRRSGEMVGGDTVINSNNEPYQSSLFLGQLKILTIWECPELTSLPECSNMEELDLSNFNERLQIITNPASCPKLREVDIDNVPWLLSSLPIESLQSLSSLSIHNDNKVESLDEFGQVLRASSSSLQTLYISKCPKLRNLSGGLGCLAALESLHLWDLPEVNLEDEEIVGDGEGDGMPWGSLCHTLLCLRVSKCKKVESIPKWMRELTSLQTLRVENCTKEVNERCQNPNGEDWPNIKHIPYIHITCKDLYLSAILV